MDDFFFNDDGPERVLQQAAGAADALIPKLEKKVAALDAELRRTIEQINRLKQIAALGRAAGEVTEGEVLPSDPRARLRFLRDRVVHEAEPALPPMEDKRIVADIDMVLRHSEPIRAKDLQAKIHKMLGHQWGESTLYSYLSRGKRTGRYINANNLWTLSPSFRETD